MDMFDKITREEIDMITAYIKTYADLSGEMCYPEPMSHILRFWNTNKKDLFKIFGEKLIIEKPINIVQPYDMMTTDIENMLYYGEGSEFYSAFCDWVCKTAYMNVYTHRQLMKLVSRKSLAKNSYEGDNIEVVLEGKKHPLQINTGCKPMRMLGKIAEHANLRGYEEFRLAHSMILNRKSFYGTLCLSIHPLDYMTMSDNGDHWTSCMSWSEDGEYRRGTVECMNSSYIVVAYLKHSEGMDMPNGYEWNSKRWRKLFVVHPDLLVGITGYPYDDDNLDNEVLNWIRELATYDYDDRRIEFYNRTPLTEKNIRFDLNFQAMYNDLEYHHHPAYFAKDLEPESRNIIMLSGESECMCCGADISDYEDLSPDLLMCPNCSGLEYCEQCGAYFDSDHMAESFDGKVMCAWCLEGYQAECDRCGTVHKSNDITEVYLYHNDKINFGHSLIVCPSCIKKIEKMCGPITEKTDRYGCCCQCVDMKNFTRSGYEVFGLNFEME